MKKIIKNILYVFFIAAISTSIATAAIIDNGTFTTDTTSGLDWLDLTETVNMTYNDVIADAAFVGWRYATVAEVTIFFESFGGDSAHFNGWSTQNNGLFDIIAPLWGDLAHESGSFANIGDGFSYATTGDVALPGTHRLVTISDQTNVTNHTTEDYVSMHVRRDDDFVNVVNGSALVRISAHTSVPEPTTFALLSIGLLAAMRLNRRKAVTLNIPVRRIII